MAVAVVVCVTVKVDSSQGSVGRVDGACEDEGAAWLLDAVGLSQGFELGECALLDLVVVEVSQGSVGLELGGGWLLDAVGVSQGVELGERVLVVVDSQDSVVLEGGG